MQSEKPTCRRAESGELSRGERKISGCCQTWNSDRIVIRKQHLHSNLRRGQHVRTLGKNVQVFGVSPESDHLIQIIMISARGALSMLPPAN